MESRVDLGLVRGEVDLAGWIEERDFYGAFGAFVQFDRSTGIVVAFRDVFGDGEGIGRG